MGIKFKCPNGHKLNVKAELAGKKGVCPKCGARFRIPEVASEEDREDGPAIDVSGGPAPTAQPVPVAATPAARAPVAPAPTAAAVPVVPSPSPAVPATQPAMALPVSAQPTSSAVPVQPVHPAAVPLQGAAIPVGGVPVVPMGSPAMAIPAGGPAAPGFAVPTPAVATPVAAAMPAPAYAAGPADPIAEAPLASWYVRPPTGGQYGPARGDILRKWLAEGRVTANSYVWREGWADWKGALEVFPALGGPAAQAGPVVTDSPAGVVSVRAARSTSRYQSGKKKSNALGLFFLGVLALLCVVMVVVLVLVLGGLK